MSANFILLIFIVSPLIILNVDAQQHGGKATGGNAQGGAGLSGAVPCYYCNNYFNGGPPLVDRPMVEQLRVLRVKVNRLKYHYNLKFLLTLCLMRNQILVDNSI